ncbi:hypothetical protein ACIP6Q_19900 [Streptomyces bobili]|uniref:hypothetical protein n=1 Tax=Streptomyces bobili TaxID=67280 RepID=UPI0037F294B3
MRQRTAGADAAAVAAGLRAVDGVRVRPKEAWAAASCPATNGTTRLVMGAAERARDVTALRLAGRPAGRSCAGPPRRH